jgi:hypothetical protein
MARRKAILQDSPFGRSDRPQQHHILLPFNRSWWVGTDIVTYAIDSTDFVDDPASNCAHDFIGKVEKVSCHVICRLDTSNTGSILFFRVLILLRADCLIEPTTETGGGTNSNSRSLLVLLSGFLCGRSLGEFIFQGLRKCNHVVPSKRQERK